MVACQGLSGRVLYNSWSGGGGGNFGFEEEGFDEEEVFGKQKKRRSILTYVKPGQLPDPEPQQNNAHQVENANRIQDIGAADIGTGSRAQKPMVNSGFLKRR